jgi:hypothetical protein
MDLAIPIRQRDHSKEVVEMVQGRGKLYAWTKKLLVKQAKQQHEKMLIKHENLWSLRLGNICGWASKI